MYTLKSCSTYIIWLSPDFEEAQVGISIVIKVEQEGRAADRDPCKGIGGLHMKYGWVGGVARVLQVLELEGAVGVPKDPVGVEVTAADHEVEQAISIEIHHPFRQGEATAPQSSSHRPVSAQHARKGVRAWHGRTN